MKAYIDSTFLCSSCGKYLVKYIPFYKYNSLHKNSIKLRCINNKCENYGKTFKYIDPLPSQEIYLKEISNDAILSGTIN